MRLLLVTVINIINNLVHIFIVNFYTAKKCLKCLILNKKRNI